MINNKNFVSDFIIDNADGYIEETTINKYLFLVSNDKNKEVLKKYTEIWNSIKSLIKTIDSKPG